jgi:hypothetical protein
LLDGKPPLPAVAVARNFALTISSLGSNAASTTTALTVLAQAAANNVVQSQKVELDQIDGRMQDKLNQQIAALQNTGDSASTQAWQSQLNQIQQQNSALTTAQAQFSNNSDTLSAIQTQLDALQTAAQNGDSASFDSALSEANTGLDNLIVVNPTPPLQADGVLGLKGAGLGIESSASYDLSTPAGQAAAENDVNNAQSLIAGIFAITTNNVIVAGSVSTSLADQYNTLSATLQQAQQNDQTQIATQTQNLTQQTQDQEHLIELALGNTTQLSSVISTIDNPPAAPTSAFGVLSDAVGATASSYGSQGTTPPILSLFA